jgi:hypothetical protein
VNFLAICQRTRQECDIPGTGPTTVVGQTGELRRIVDWCATAWTDIQNKATDWRWMRRSFTVNTTSSDDQYASSDCTDTTDSAVISRFSHWLIDCDTPLLIYLTSAGVGTQHELTYWDWNDFKRVYKMGTQNTGYPSIWSIDPNNNLRLGPSPNGIYTVTGDYQMSAETLALDATTPGMPSQFHMLIVYEAMKKYAGFAGAPEVFARAQLEGGPMMLALQANQLPRRRLGGSLI